jgi:hypothetical protein
MRLINTETLELKEFIGDCTEPYAILSHTWGAEEINMQEMIQATSKVNKATAIRNKEGFRKIANSVTVAAKDGYKYVWVDTCCIDKTSSAELSEAINSMFRWYRDSSICYAYLADFLPSSQPYHVGKDLDQFSASRWFTRGWTLQELIAPRTLRFYSQSWTVIGSKESLADTIWKVTGIPKEVLKTGDPSSECVAHRMSWAVSRSTTRVEDMAYSLMGIFDINMPLLYGEGSKAFMRLQEEIMKTSDDHTILAWRHQRTHGEGPSYWSYRSLLARSPVEFSSVYDLKLRQDDESMINPFINTSIGLNTTLMLLRVVDALSLNFNPPLDRHDETDEYIAILPVSSYNAIVAIQLKRLSPKGRHFVRVRPDILYTISNQGSFARFASTSIYVRNVIRIPGGHQALRFGGLVVADVNNNGLANAKPPIPTAVPPHGTWHPDKSLLQFSPTMPDNRFAVVGYLLFHHPEFRLYFGVYERGTGLAFRVTEASDELLDESYWRLNGWFRGSFSTRIDAPLGDAGLRITIESAFKLADNDLVVCQLFINYRLMKVPPKTGAASRDIFSIAKRLINI